METKPTQPRAPNDETARVLNDSQEGKNVTTFETPEGLFDDLDI